MKYSEETLFVYSFYRLVSIFSDESITALSQEMK